MLPAPRRAAALLALALVLLAPSAPAQLVLPEAEAEPPDLIGANLDIDPQQPHVAQDVTLCGTAQNVGPGTVGAPFDVLLRIDGVDDRVHRVNPPLQSGDGARVCWAVRLPVGTHTFTIVVDPEGAVAEKHEDNNVPRARAFEVLDVPMPNLVFHRVGVTPSVGSRGTQLFYAEVRNAGHAASGATWLDIEDDHGRIARLAVPALSPGQAAFAGQPTQPEERHSGNFTARFLIDPGDKVRESVEVDNEFLVPYAIAPHPAADLVVANATLTGEPTERKPHALHVVIQNVGSKAAPPSVVRLVRDNATVANASLRTLAQNASETVVFPLRLAQGDHTLRVVADATATVVEHDEANNAHDLRVRIHPPITPTVVPNLVATRLDAAPDDPGPDEVVTLTALVGNDGEAAATDVSVAFFADGGLVATTLVKRLGPGEHAAVTAAWAERGFGSHTVRVVVDPDERIPERDEDDNALAATVYLRDHAPRPPEPTDDNRTTPAPEAPATDPETPRPPPDEATVELAPVAISDIQVRAAPVPEGVRGTVVVALRNPNLDPAGRMTVAFFVDGQPLKEVLVQEIGPAATRSFTSGEVSLPPGRHVVRAEVRPLGSDAPVASAERTYDVEAGERGLVPGPGAAVVLAAALAAARRRR